MPPHHLALLFLVLLLSSPTLSLAASACASEKFPAGRKYANCEDLPQLGAALHWTYDDATAALSLAFVAAPAKPGGWVAWGLNPIGSGMAGAQALVALRPSPSAPVAVRTYNITGYVPLGGDSTPLAFPATELAADEESGGKIIRVYGKLQLRKGMKEVSQVWQVGPSVSKGAPDKHDVAAGNLAAKATLVLAGGSGKAAAGPAPAPTSGGGPDAGEGAGTVTAPAAGTTTPSASASAAGMSSATFLVLASAAAFFLA
ncbi:auxin-induced in root cultures protein 12 [Brachypodium distachyon]|uniref:DOMON domain-containing protein n=1 Tax=Brachypodium distachyon TaxID=15368 RepID=I1I8S2_BRADI|nr:auxin-induced in root cultures protein 12 [Brachypodium distachyon]KQJ99063.1 hypothetical protein BRADI_3g40830v3 [Brachypodium distachyon]|eukprot:XP_003572421.3 auxin-induced in root cultures protein 12 [Brachypodium distachyon]